MQNKIYNENCLETMKRMPDCYIDLTVTSPPYDNLRDYKGYSFDFETIAKELYRVTKEGGTVVWIVNDATVKGSETGTSFKQALGFMQIGFNLHDTMVWNKGTFSSVGSLQTRYASVFEYMFILTKGKIKTFNPIKDRKNKWAGSPKHGTMRCKDGSTKPLTGIGKPIAEFGQRFNIWDIIPEKNNRGDSHPAPFSETLANDHIISWSNEGDLVYDPFTGSGTTLKMAIVNKRHYLGSEIATEYYDMATRRISNLI